MPAIATLTMNPALDLSTATERVEPTHKLRCGPPRYDPGGGGINVARVAKILGSQAAAVYPAGGPIGAMLRAGLDSLGVVQHVIPIAGNTRESFTVGETETGNEYRFVLPGPELSAAEQRRCIEAVEALEPRPEYLVVSGGLPPGVDAAALIAEVAGLARSAGAKLVVDSPEAMRHAPPGVFLIKPNLRELSIMVGRPLKTRADQVAAARSLVRQGRAEAVVVSMAGEGALLVGGALGQHFAAPDVPARSTVGAGDSMVGGIVVALERGWSLSDAVRYGVAAGTATIMTPGTELCRREDVERLFATMTAPTDLGEGQ